PLEREGVLYYHVMAGPLPDTAMAVAVRDTLVARGRKTAPTPNDVRSAPLAFVIGDYSSLETAAEQIDELRRQDVPGYVTPASAVDGRRLYRIYVGGYATEAEADVAGQLLRAAGITDSLVIRTGSITP